MSGITHVHRLGRDGAPEPADAAPGKLLAGSPRSDVWNAFSDPSGRFHAGIWRAEAGIRAVNYTETELCVILEGRVRLTSDDLTSDDGRAEFGPGDAFVVAAGFSGTWECIGEVAKIYAILEP